MQTVGGSEFVDFHRKPEVFGKQRVQLARFWAETVNVPPSLKEHEVRSVPNSNEPMRIEHSILSDTERISGNFGKDFAVFGGMGIEPSHAGVLKIENRRGRQYVLGIVAMPGVTGHGTIKRSRARSELGNGRTEESEREGDHPGSGITMESSRFRHADRLLNSGTDGRTRRNTPREYRNIFPTAHK